MRFTPTAITLPALALVLCWAGLPDDCTIIAVAGQTEPAPARLSQDEIDVLVRSVRFSAPERIYVCPERDPDFEVRFDCPGATASGRHPRYIGGSSSLQHAVEAHRREVFRRVEKAFGEHLRWLEEEGPAPAVLEYTEAWELSEIGGDLVSLFCDGLWYGAGVHSNVFYQTVTFWDDGEAAREIDLEDLFLSDLPWREELTRLVRRQLLDSGATGDVHQASLGCWRLTSTGIVFLYPPYEVASFADGSFAPFIPFGELRRFLDPDGPLGEILR